MEQKDLLQQQTGNIQPDTPNEPLIEREQLEGTPFWMIKIQDQYNLIMGKYKLTDVPLKDKEEIFSYLQTNMYNIITRIVAIIANNMITDYMKDEKETKPQTKNEWLGKINQKNHDKP